MIGLAVAETSKESYQLQLWSGRVNRDELKVLTAMKELGGSCADFEISKKLFWHQSRVSARRNGLVRKGLVEDSGERKMRSMFRYGKAIPRRVIVWRIIPHYII